KKTNTFPVLPPPSPCFNGATPPSVCVRPSLGSSSSRPPPHLRCFSSLSPPLLTASPCRLLGGLLRNILSSPLRASVR
uniref:Uncharacterized protein n=1 Tax=Takifugu rubripes TaxID=31033 RepID=A0A674MJQ7_TAKRU